MSKEDDIKKQWLRPSVRIIGPSQDPLATSGTVIVQLAQQSHVERLVEALTEGKDRQQENTSVLGQLPSDDLLMGVSAERQVLVKTAIKLFRLNKLSVSTLGDGKGHEKTIKILMAIYTREHVHSILPSGRIAELTGIKLTTLLRQLDQMEAKELITRKSDSFDNRVNSVSLTAKARQMLDSFFAIAAKHFGSV